MQPQFSKSDRQYLPHSFNADPLVAVPRIYKHPTNRSSTIFLIDGTQFDMAHGLIAFINYLEDLGLGMFPLTQLQIGMELLLI